jgi:hypothetical protein
MTFEDMMPLFERKARGYGLFTLVFQHGTSVVGDLIQKSLSLGLEHICVF